MNTIPEEVISAAKRGITVLCKTHSQLKEIKKILGSARCRVAVLDSWLSYRGQQFLNKEKTLTKNETILIIKSFLNSEKNPIVNFNLDKTSETIYQAINTIELNDCIKLMCNSLEKKLTTSAIEYIEDYCNKTGATTVYKNINAAIDIDKEELPNNLVIYAVNTTDEPKLIQKTITKLSEKIDITFTQNNNLSITTGLGAQCKTIDDEINQCINFCLKITQDTNKTVAVTSPIYNSIKSTFETEILRKKQTLSDNINEVINTEPTKTLSQTNIGKQILEILKNIGNEEPIRSDQAFQFTLTEIHKKLTSNPLQISSPIEHTFVKTETDEFTRNEKDTEGNDPLTSFFEIEDAINIDEFEAYFEQFSDPEYPQTETDFNEQANQEIEDFELVIQTLAKVNIYKIAPRTFKNEELFNFYSEQFKRTKITKNYTHQITFKNIDDITGLNYDHIWVLGANVEYWQKMTHTNPLLPVEINTRINTDELLLKLKTQCYELIVSFSNYANDAPLLPPTQVNELISFSPDDTKYQVNKPQTTITETVCDTYTNEYTFDHMHPCNIELLNKFKDCPFKANMENTLKNGVINKWEDQRSRIIKLSLSLFWRKFRGSINARKFDSNYIEKAADKIIEKSAKQIIKNQDEWFVQNEIKIVTNIVKVNIHNDLKRRFILTSNLASHTIEVNNMFLNVPVDRIELAEETDTYNKFKHHVCINNRRTSLNAWQGLNISDFLVPAQTLLPKVKATSELALNSSTNEYQTFHDENSHIINSFNAKTQSKTYKEMTAIWQVEIERTLEKLQSGYALNRPNKPVICRTCKFKSVCRINENT